MAGAAESKELAVIPPAGTPAMLQVPAAAVIVLRQTPMPPSPPRNSSRPRCYDLPVVEPLVNSELLTNRVTVEHEKLFIEFFPELTLPLKRQVGGAHDERRINYSTQLA